LRFCNSSGLTATPSHQRRICESDTVCVVAGPRTVISMGVPSAIWRVHKPKSLSKPFGINRITTKPTAP
jgi:hypothetical protein